MKSLGLALVLMALALTPTDSANAKRWYGLHDRGTWEHDSTKSSISQAVLTGNPDRYASKVIHFRELIQRPHVRDSEGQPHIAFSFQLFTGKGCGHALATPTVHTATHDITRSTKLVFSYQPQFSKRGGSGSELDTSGVTVAVHVKASQVAEIRELLKAGSRIRQHVRVRVSGNPRGTDDDCRLRDLRLELVEARVDIEYPNKNQRTLFKATFGAAAEPTYGRKAIALPIPAAP